MEPIREDDLHFARKVLERRSGQLMDELSALKRRIQEESIHDTRVASRRMRSALEAFQDLLPPDGYQACYDSIKSITKTLGRAREEEVTLALLAELTNGGDLAENLCREYLEERYRRQLEQLHQSMLRRLPRLNIRSLRSRLGALCTGLGQGAPHPLPAVADSPGPASTLVRSRRRRSDPRQASLFSPPEAPPGRAQRVVGGAAAPVLSFRSRYDFPRASDERLHKLRIAVKKLRYAMEVFGPIWPGGLDQEISASRVLQDTAGEYHDWAVLRARMQADIRRLTNKEQTHLAFQIGRLLAQVEDHKQDKRKAILPALTRLQAELGQALLRASGRVIPAEMSDAEAVEQPR